MTCEAGGQKAQGQMGRLRRKRLQEIELTDKESLMKRICEAFNRGLDMLLWVAASAITLAWMAAAAIALAWIAASTITRKKDARWLHYGPDEDIPVQKQAHPVAFEYRKAA